MGPGLALPCELEGVQEPVVDGRKCLSNAPGGDFIRFFSQEAEQPEERGAGSPGKHSGTGQDHRPEQCRAHNRREVERFLQCQGGEGEGHPGEKGQKGSLQRPGTVLIVANQCQPRDQDVKKSCHWCQCVRAQTTMFVPKWNACWRFSSGSL